MEKLANRVAVGSLIFRPYSAGCYPLIFFASFAFFPRSNVHHRSDIDLDQPLSKESAVNSGESGSNCCCSRSI